MNWVEYAEIIFTKWLVSITNIVLKNRDVEFCDTVKQHVYKYLGFSGTFNFVNKTIWTWGSK